MCLFLVSTCSRLPEISRFEAIGTKVIVCSDAELLMQLMDKDLFYRSVKSTGIMVVPDYHVVRTAAAFREAYEELAAKGHQVCFKPTNAEGGMGFRIIDNERDRLEDLMGAVNHYVTFDEAYQLLSSVGEFNDLMVMELLDGLEYSIDCLADPAGHLLAAVPRRKAGGRLRLMEAVPELLEIAQQVADTYKIPYNYNIQMKYKNGVPKLLEINPEDVRRSACYLSDGHQFPLPRGEDGARRTGGASTSAIRTTG